MRARGWLERQWRSLRVRLLLPVALMMIAIVAVLASVVTQKYTQTLLDQENAKIQTSFSITGQAIGALLESVQTTASRMAMDGSVERYAAGNFSDDLELVMARKELLTALDSTLQQQPTLYGLLFIRENKSAFGRLPYRSFFFDEDAANILDESFMEYVMNVPWGTLGWTGPFLGADLYRIKTSDKIPERVVMGVSNIKNRRYGTLYAVSVIDTQKLGDYLDLLADGRSSIYLTTEDGTQLAQSLGSAQLAEDSWTAMDVSSQNANSCILHPTEGERVYASYQRIDSLGWYLVRELPIDDFDRSARELRNFVWITALLVFCAALLWYAQWLHRFMKTFDSLKAAIVSLRGGRLETRIEQPYHITEFESIRQEFNQMNATLETLMEKTRAMERAHLELEMRNLQTQLSPHMIFNSITAIRWMASMMGANRVADMLMELSEMLRPIFRDWKIEWTLGEELAHLDHYAKLLGLRYGNQFSMTYDVPAELNGTTIPRFTLQPLVENACEHGGASSGALHVKIQAWTANGRVFVTVWDDGSGISQEDLEKIRRQITQNQRTDSIGLCNVYNRLKICRGADSELKVESPPEGGTHVEISWKTTSESYETKN